jgi:glucan phosphoethanolaminetransferase (alkaline phosphatase superfamily)
MKQLLLFFLILILLIFAQAIHDPFYIFKQAENYARPYDMKGIGILFMYLGGYVLVAYALYLIVKIRSNIIFTIFIVIFFLFYAIDFFMQLLGTSYGFSYNEFILAMHEAGNIQNLLSYLDDIIYAIVFSFIFSLLFFLLRKIFFKTNLHTFKTVISFILLAFLGTAVPAYTCDYVTHKVYPAFAKIPVISLVYLRHKPQVKQRILDSSIHPRKSKFQNIIWVIDESVTGTYLSINGYEKDTTPYLKTLDTTSKMVNFGVVNSVSNCSSTSNLSLRIGLNPKTIPEFEKNMYDLPTIFQYAKRAGYTTWLIDTQSQKDYLQNYMSLYDKKDIDNFITLDDDTVPHTRDMSMIKKIQELTKGASKNFIITVKFGAHWPYILDFPVENTVFTPVIETTYGMTQENKEKQINTYANAILYSTDHYLEELIKDSDLSKSIIFYTSDHGQNILETEGKITHCNNDNIVKNEVSVPLMVFQEDAKKLFKINKEHPNYSHVQIFPTSLALMGFDKNITKKYGKTLWESFSEEEDRKFFIYVSGQTQVYK